MKWKSLPVVFCSRKKKAVANGDFSVKSENCYLWWLKMGNEFIVTGDSTVENENHCDFVKLREMLIRINMEDLREVTHSLHFELYRRHKLEEMGFSDSEAKRFAHIFVVFSRNGCCMNFVIRCPWDICSNSVNECVTLLGQRSWVFWIIGKFAYGDSRVHYCAPTFRCGLNTYGREFHIKNL